MKFTLKKILLFLGSFLLIFCYTYFYSTLFNDEIWNYGFSYNIASGLIPYRDFNMIVTPLYSFIGSIFIRVFGHHLWSFHIFNSIMIVVMLYFIYQEIGKKVLLFIPMLLLYCYPSYNLFCVFIMVILLSFCDKEFKYYDFLMAIFCGVLFLTKQTIGICVFLPMIYYSKHKFLSIISFLFPIFIVFIYLVWNGAFYQFIDYCFLGMFDFSSSNKILFFLPFEFIVCFYLGFRLFKSKFRERKVFYILMFQIITVPIMDDNHFMMGFMLVYLYLLENHFIWNYRYKYYVLILFFGFGYWNYLANDYSSLHYFQDRDSYLFGRYVPEYIEEKVIRISQYMESIKGEYDYVFLLTQNSYMIKLNTSFRLNKFDLINNGNMGYQGSFRYIQEIRDKCKDSFCLFMVYQYEVDDDNPTGSQTNVDILDYVMGGYDLFQEVDDFILYRN